MNNYKSVYTLYLSQRSPFARRVKIALLRLKINFVEVKIDAFSPTDEFLYKQPIATVPALEIENGVTIPDSTLILEFLDQTSGKKIWSNDSLQVRIVSAYCEAIMTNSVNYFLETLKASQDLELKTEFENNIKRLIASFEKIERKYWINETGPTQAAFDYVVAIDYLSLRIPSILVHKMDFYNELQKNIFIKETKPVL